MAWPKTKLLFSKLRDGAQKKFEKMLEDFVFYGYSEVFDTISLRLWQS